MPGVSMKWHRVSGSKSAPNTSQVPSPSRRRCRRPRSSAAPTASAPGRPASTRNAPRSRTSKSTAAIADWATIPPRSTPSPTGWPSPRVSGRSSIAPAGRAWSIRIGAGLKSSGPRASRSLMTMGERDARGPEEKLLLLLDGAADLVVGLLHAVLHDLEGIAARLLHQLGDVARIGDRGFHRLLGEVGLLGHDLLRAAAGLVGLDHGGDVLDRLLEDLALLLGD